MTATMITSPKPAADSDDFDLIARAFVAEDEFERDASWTTLVEALADDTFGRTAPEQLVAPGLDHLWVGA